VAPKQTSTHTYHDRGKGVSDPLPLDTLELAIFVMRCFEKGATVCELVDNLKGDISLANAHFLFFRQAGWLQGDFYGKWRLNERGRQTLDFLLNGLDKQMRG
jgi:hypothetical protein